MMNGIIVQRLCYTVNLRSMRYLIEATPGGLKLTGYDWKPYPCAKSKRMFGERQLSSRPNVRRHSGNTEDIGSIGQPAA